VRLLSASASASAGTSERGAARACGHASARGGNRVLVAAIRLYRRRLSGRGPLRRVACSFHHGESCSAYGLRVASERGAWDALGLITARLRRCRRLAVYTLARPANAHAHAHAHAGARGLGWGDGLALAPADLAAELHAADERADSAAVAWHARLAVARWRGEPLAAHQAAAALAALDPTSRAAAPILRVVSPVCWSRLLGPAAAAGALAILLGALVGAWWPGALLAAALLAPAARRTGRQQRLLGATRAQARAGAGAAVVRLRPPLGAATRAGGGAPSPGRQTVA